MNSSGPAGPEHNDFSAVADEVLMQMIATGNREAYQEFLQRYLLPVMQFARRYVDNVQDAEDIAHDTLLQVWHRAHSWQPRGPSVRSWLYRVAYHRAIDFLRKHKRTLQHIDADTLSGPSTEHQAIQDNLQAQLQQAIRQLPERQQTALLLHLYHGLDNIEAAAAMDCSIEAVESLLARARRTLKQRLLQER